MCNTQSLTRIFLFIQTGSRWARSAAVFSTFLISISAWRKKNVDGWFVFQSFTVSSLYLFPSKVFFVGTGRKAFFLQKPEMNILYCCLWFHWRISVCGSLWMRACEWKWFWTLILFSWVKWDTVELFHDDLGPWSEWNGLSGPVLSRKRAHWKLIALALSSTFNVPRLTVTGVFRTVTGFPEDGLQIGDSQHVLEHLDISVSLWFFRYQL